MARYRERLTRLRCLDISECRRITPRRDRAFLECPPDALGRGRHLDVGDAELAGITLTVHLFRPWGAFEERPHRS